jgi:hypothetical protein
MLCPVITVSPVIEPGNIVFPSHKNNVYILFGVLLLMKRKQISSSARGLSVMTLRECHVDRSFPVT